MERFLTRQQIRQRLRVISGQSQSESLSGQTFDRHNEYIRLANEEVLTRRQWATTRLEAAGTLGVDQRTLNYPANCRAENIEGLAVWSNGDDTTAGYYIPLRKARIPLILDTDPLTAEGGDIAAAVRGMPTRYEPKNTIEIWKLPDVAYLYKLDYTVNPALEDEITASVVDAITILHFAAEQEFDFLGDADLAQKQRARGEARLALISAWQQAGERVAIDNDITFDEDRGPITYYNIDTSGRPG